MSARSQSRPLIVLAKLWAKTSGKGVRYFLGKLGGVCVLIMPNKERQDKNDPSYILLFAEAGECSEKNGGAR